MDISKNPNWTIDKSKASLRQRPRRNRKSAAMRALVCETRLSASDLILPLFVIEGHQISSEVSSMPGISRFSRDLIVEQARQAKDLNIPAVALFPALSENLKNKYATESTNPEGLLQKTIQDIKNAVPEILVISDVAMDPYSIDGHDGLVQDGKILNDETLEILADMAIAQAKAGADIVAPSDMMDGRVGVIRKALDENGFQDVSILSYAAKYASAFYGPFRDALDSAPRGGDKKTYQMDPGNVREALREVKLDIEEGADIVMIKPALAYLDVIQKVKQISDVPVAAYQVSGEYAMLKAAGQKGWLDADACLMESLIAIKRAGADIILTYAALEIARVLVETK